MFQASASYPAWIRFSNNADPQADIEADVRGMALKLLEVDGSKLFEPDPNARTQDFLLVSHPVFVFPDVATYSQAFEAFADERALSSRIVSVATDGTSATVRIKAVTILGMTFRLAAA